MKIVTGPQGAVDISKDGQLIARVFPQGDESDTFALAYSVVAAPDLLAACKLLVEAERLGEGETNERARAWDVLVAATEAARAAIEKATVKR